MAKELIIVTRDNPDLLESLRQEFSGQPDVQVLVDRRTGDRRPPNGATAPERRRAEQRTLQEAELLQTMAFFRVAAAAAGDAFIEVKRMGPPTPQQVSGRVFTWTAALNQYPPKPWRELFGDTKDRSIDHSPDKVRFYQTVLIFDSDEDKVPNWVHFIDGWIRSANERYMKRLDTERRLREEEEALSRDPKGRLKAAADRFKNL
ncbi:MAG: hypothetical protein FJZ38_00020 [Candidatus Rokubacteria bacterium]|nr:hypothetical protein [Candidatus Rokubacteria bacterium]